MGERTPILMLPASHCQPVSLTRAPFRKWSIWGKIKQNLIIAGDGASGLILILLVQSCPAGTSSVTAKFTGNADTQDPTAWKNHGPVMLHYVSPAGIMRDNI